LLVGYIPFFPAAFTFAHLALAASASLALSAGLWRRSFYLAALPVAFLPFILSHLARCAAAILALLARDMRRRRIPGDPSVVGESVTPPLALMESIRPCKVSIRCLMAMIRLSWPIVKWLISVVIGHR
jgi:hypothetical protein